MSYVEMRKWYLLSKLYNNKYTMYWRILLYAVIRTVNVYTNVNLYLHSLIIILFHICQCDKILIKYKWQTWNIKSKQLVSIYVCIYNNNNIYTRQTKVGANLFAINCD